MCKCACTACENVYAFWQLDTPQFLSQMYKDFVETWYDLQVGIKDAPKKILSNKCKHVDVMRINVHACFYNHLKLLNSAEFDGDEENKSFSGGFNVYSCQLLGTCTCTQQPKTGRELVCLDPYIRLHTSDLNNLKKGPLPIWQWLTKFLMLLVMGQRPTGWR